MNVWIRAALVLAAVATCVSARIFFVGSNPYQSMIAYPQDVLQFPGNYLYYYPSYQKLPWWGDMDEPMRRPNDTYTATGQSITNDDGSRFYHEAEIRADGNQVGMWQRWRENFINVTDLRYTFSSQINVATGSFNTDTTGTLPFDYRSTATNHDIYLQSIFGFKLGTIPVGVKVGGGLVTLSEPDQQFTFTRSGQQIETERLVWGWSTSPCAHIFNTSGVAGDAWFQDAYAQGPQYRFDLQLGATVPRAKIGARVRYTGGSQTQYEWTPDPARLASAPDSVLWARFYGDYVESDVSRELDDFLVRLYGNVFWKKAERYTLGTLLFLSYNGATTTGVSTANFDVQNGLKETARNVVVEINPNISVKPTEHSYIDAALLLEYSYRRLEHLGLTWAGNGQVETYRQSWAVVGDETWWEDFSYGNENFLDVGIDLALAVPVVGRANGSLTLGLSLLANSKFTWLNKYYGHNDVVGDNVDFVIDNVRENFRREFWFNSAINLQVRYGRSIVRLEVTEPLLYMLQPETRLTDEAGDATFYASEKYGNWASQEGAKVALFFARDLGGPLFGVSR